MNQPSVAIVILNWNGKHHLQQFLPAVIRTRYPGLRIIVADNASTDGSDRLLKESFPEVEWLPLLRNHGFAKGYNEALKQVSADYFVLLNSDVEVTPDWLAPMISLLQTNAAYAACQPKIKAYQNKAMFEYAGAGGGWLDTLGYPFARGRIFDVCERDERQYNDPAPVFWATGAALLIKRPVFLELGGFDEYFFAHQEEIDLCWRMQLAGYTVLVCPQSEVYHVGGGTLPRGHSKKTFLNFRNNHIMLAKNLHWTDWWKIPLRLQLDIVSAVKGLLAGDAGYALSILKAHLGFFYWLITGSRRWTPLRRQPLRKLLGVYNGSLVWQHFIRRKNFFREVVTGKKN